MVKEQHSGRILFIGNDRSLLNNLLREIFEEEEISVIFSPSWDNGIKYMKNNELRLVIIDSLLISRLRPSAVLPIIKKTKAIFFLINTMPDMWIYNVMDSIKRNSVYIFKKPLYIDKFLKLVKRVWKRR